MNQSWIAVPRRLAVLAVLQLTMCLMTATAQPRAGLLDGEDSTASMVVITAQQDEKSSAFTLGTFACIGWAFEKFSHYKVNDSGRVYREREGDNLVYGVFALPSINLSRKLLSKIPIAVILPLGVMKSSNGDANATFGLGLSFGFDVGDHADVGFAVVGLFSGVESLTDQQQVSLETGTPLGAAVNREIGTVPVASVTVGVYITPHF